MSEIFEETTINNMTLANRFIRSATWEGMAAENGACTARLVDLMVQLARGGVGLIITGHTYVTKNGQAGPRQLGLHSDELVAGLKDMAGAVHRAGGKIVLQLSHAGGLAPSKLTDLEALGPSVIEEQGSPVCREITIEEIQDIIRQFGLAALRAKNAGFDGVQIHAAHGYLLSQFLSPFYNKRQDEYGGNIENRARIIMEVLRNIRNFAGNDFPMLIKLNSEDFLEGGFTVSDMVQVAEMLEDSGIDAIELSGGTAHSGKFWSIRKGKASPKNEVYYKDAAKKYKQKIRVPLMLVGGIRSYEVAEDLIKNGVDYVSLCRPLIREPDLINRWMSGDRRRSTCVSDNLCLKAAVKGKGLYCVAEENA
ncbi:MAG: NADH:flavin oxidoreductase [Thermodesulfobacteriota bacterium]|nr:NADH:flavin oxidoreductase [Thermodesulfobacteriota bacterium]